LASEKIRVLIVDDFADTRESIAKLLYFEKDIEVVGSAGSGPQGIQMAKELGPDVILMDINMPGMDGITATEAIYAEMPECEVIMMSVQGEPDFLRRAMLAGAREYLTKPFTGDELAGSIRHVYELVAEKRCRMTTTAQPSTAVPVPEAQPEESGRVIAVFGPKGGVGRTTVATNVAIALKTLADKRVALVDCSLVFGDVGIMLNLTGNTTISDIIPNIHAIDPDLLERVLVQHSSGIRVLLAPPRPELAELITADHLRTIVKLLKTQYDYVVIDTHPSFDDATLAMLDLAERIVVLTTLEMPAIKNLKLFLEVAEALNYPQEKLVLAVNRSDSTGGIRAEDIEQNIRVKISANIMSSGQLMIAAVNQGVPVVLSERESPVAQQLMGLAKVLLTGEDAKGALARENEMGRPSKENKHGRGFGKIRLSTFVPFASKKGNG
jgi:pilus assembly protein CpaE